MYLVVLLLLGGSCSFSAAYDSDYQDGMAHVVVGLNHLVATDAETKEALVQTKALYQGPQKHMLAEFAAQYNATVTTELQHTHAVALTLPHDQVALLEQDATFVQYLEWDPLVYYFGNKRSGGSHSSGGSTGGSTGVGGGSHSSRSGSGGSRSLAETVTWSNTMVGALSAQLPPAPSNQVDNEFCFKLCVVDAGVLINHPDIVRILVCMR